MDLFGPVRYDPNCRRLESPRQPSGNIMNHSVLQDIETRIEHLSTSEKQILMDRLAHDLRTAKHANADIGATLSRMAADPDIQREIREIEQEFANAAEDGLEDL